MEMKSQEKRSSALFLSIFILSVLGFVTAGSLYYFHYEQQYRNAIDSQLTAITDLKVNALVNWRAERISDAQTLYQNEAFSALLASYMNGSPGAQTDLKEWLQKYLEGSQYDQIRILDPQGKTRLMIPDSVVQVSDAVMQSLPEVWQTGKITLVDFYRSETDQKVHLTLLVPIFDAQTGKYPVGMIALRIDPNLYLYPFIQSWPALSNTAETILLRRDTDNALYLNDLRFQQNTALTLRRPLSDSASPAVKAVLGHTGMIEGVDYRGIQVVAEVRNVPDSPWFLEARMDATEVYAPLRERIWLIVIVFGLIIIGTGAGLWLLWRQQSLRFYREQAQAAEKLSDSELRYRRLFETAKDGILILEAETGLVLDANPFLQDMLGFPLDDLKGKALWELGGFKDVAANQTNFLKLQQEGYIRYDNLPLQTAQGQPFYVEFVSNIYLVGHRNVIQCNIRDITERKQTLDALRESQNRYQLIFDNSGTVNSIFDTECRLIMQNSLSVQNLGMKPGEAMGKTALEIFGLERGRAVTEHMQRVFCSGVSESFETDFNLPTGKKWFRSVYQPIFDERHILFGIQVISQDITEHKLAEAALRESEEKFRHLVWDMQVGVLLQGPQAEILLSNSKALELLGVTEDQLLGKTSFDPDWNVIHEDGLPFPGPTHPVPQAISSCQPVLNVIMGVYRPTTRNRVWLLVDAVPEFNDDGKLRQVVCTFIDITARKEAEKALQEAHDQLEQRVQERTAELQNANLQLEKASRTKDEFLAAMSHELRTPLTGILGLSEIMQMPGQGPLTEKQGSYLSKIHDSGQHLLELINDILDFSNIKTGQFDLDLIPCSLHEICQNSLQLMAAQASAKLLKFSFSTTPENITINVDARRFQKILANLISNAVKFTPNGGSYGIDVFGNREDGLVHITVWDTGIGIKDEDQVRLFQPFVQLDARLARQYNGTGLGLALVRRLTELHDGSVCVQSAPGKGSRFTVTLPWQPK